MPFLPPLVLLPGLDGTGIGFEPLRRVLPPDTAVSVVRYPTDRLLDFEDTLCCAAAQIPCAPDALVIAESFSGLVAAALLGGGRIRARGLVLCAAFARSPRPVFFSLLERLPAAALLRVPFPRRLMGHVVQGGPDSVDVFLPLWQRVQAMVEPRVLMQRLRLINRIDVRPYLPRLTLPCAYLQAAGDRTVPQAAMEDFRAALPQLQVYRIDGPHFILQARPQACLAAVYDFWRQAADRPA